MDSIQYKELAKPACYKHFSDEEWQGACEQMMEDLDRLARQDGHVAAAWAHSVILNYVKRVLSAGEWAELFSSDLPALLPREDLYKKVIERSNEIKEGRDEP
jgi:thiaminase